MPKPTPQAPRALLELMQLGFSASSGYWGPAYNETKMQADGFITAWGEGTSEPDKIVGDMPEYRASDRTP